MVNPIPPAPLYSARTIPAPMNATASSSRVRPIIDPAFAPLPEDDEDDLDIQRSDVRTLLYAKAKPAIKIAGSRRSLPEPKGEGKGRAIDEVPVKASKRKASQAVTDREVKKPRGRVQGVANYSEEDVDALLDTLETSLPVGGKAWVNVEHQFRDWAAANDRPARTAKSLEAKFKQVCYVVICLSYPYN